MWWSRPARFVLLASALALAACGFTPAYGPGGAATAFRNATAITAPETTQGYRLLARLEDRLGRAEAARWHLVTTFTITESPAALGTTGNILRYNLTGVVDWRLENRETGELVAADTLRAFVGYGTGASTVSVRAAEQDARDRLAVILADMLVTRLIALSPAPTAEQ